MLVSLNDSSIASSVIRGISDSAGGLSEDQSVLGRFQSPHSTATRGFSSADENAESQYSLVCEVVRCDRRCSYKVNYQRT